MATRPVLGGLFKQPKPDATSLESIFKEDHVEMDSPGHLAGHFHHLGNHFNPGHHH